MAQIYRTDSSGYSDLDSIPNARKVLDENYAYTEKPVAEFATYNSLSELSEDAGSAQSEFETSDYSDNASVYEEASEKDFSVLSQLFVSQFEFYSIPKFSTTRPYFLTELILLCAVCDVAFCFCVMICGT